MVTEDLLVYNSLKCYLLLGIMMNFAHKAYTLRRTRIFQGNDIQSLNIYE